MGHRWIGVHQSYWRTTEPRLRDLVIRLHDQHASRRQITVLSDLLSILHEIILSRSKRQTNRKRRRRSIFQRTERDVGGFTPINGTDFGLVEPTQPQLCPRGDARSTRQLLAHV